MSSSSAAESAALHGPMLPLDDQLPLHQHLHGSITTCGDTVFLTMPRVTSDAGSEFFVGRKCHSEEQKQAAWRELRQSQLEASEKHGLRINTLYEMPADAMAVAMLLDADFSEEPEAVAIVNKAALPLLQAQQWGVRRVDGKSYACSVAQTGSLTWLHDLLCSDPALTLQKYAGDTLDCRPANLQYMPVALETPVQMPAEHLSLAEAVSGMPVLSGALRFEKPAKYPNGRWYQYYKAAGKTCKMTVSMKSAAPEEAVRAKQRLIERLRVEVGLYPGQERTPSWRMQHAAELNGTSKLVPAAGCLEYHTSNGHYITRNSLCKDEVAHEILRHGAWLRGRVLKHREGLWCFATEASTGEHFRTQQEAEKRLKEVNNQHPYSINPWMPYLQEQEFDDHIVTHARRIFTGGVESMLVSDDKDVLEAIAEHHWVPEAGTNRACNANPDSIWRYAEDLVAWMYVKRMRSTNNRLLVPDAKAFFDCVHLENPVRLCNDYRAHSLQVYFLKVNRSVLNKNKEANDKIRQLNEQLWCELRLDGKLKEQEEDVQFNLPPIVCASVMTYDSSASRPGDDDPKFKSDEYWAEQEDLAITQYRAARAMRPWMAMRVDDKMTQAQVRAVMTAAFKEQQTWEVLRQVPKHRECKEKVQAAQALKAAAGDNKDKQEKEHEQSKPSNSLRAELERIQARRTQAS